MLSLSNISKSYGSRVLLDNVTFTLGSAERVGLVGRNGHGKTTLLNIIAGLDAADTGEIIVPRAYKVGYLAQRFLFSHPDVRTEAISALPPDKIDMHYLAEKILFGLGFETATLNMSPDKLSGGFQVRLNLAKLLISAPNLLLLDEPTNYLDILSARWLKSFLTSSWEGEIMLVTHDRAFMDSVVTHIAGIHRARLRKIAGNTGAYYERIAQDEEIYEKTRLNDEAKRKEIEAFVKRFKAKASLASRAQSRVKTLEKMEHKDKLAKIEELEFSFQYKPTVSRNIMQVADLSFAYAGKAPLFKNLSFTVSKGEKICIIGKNGAGKSTLLRVLASLLTPTAGNVLVSEVPGYFEQTNVSSLSPESTVEEEVARAGDYKLDKTKVRTICGNMLFSGNSALKQVKVLSGGEKCRVMLGKILARPYSLLLLDEPTNHLDMDASESLLEALLEFEGGIILVTHNESYLNSLADRLIVFQGAEPFLFEGSYQEFLEKIGWDTEEGSVRKKTDRRKGRHEKAQLVMEKSRALKPLAEKIKALEEAIVLVEARHSELHNEIDVATQKQDGLLLTDLGVKLSALDAKNDDLYEELNRVTVAYDEKAFQYDKLLSEFD